jgi:peptidoglycan/LPS O-acetylase OafA/YrhL
MSTDLHTDSSSDSRQNNLDFFRFALATVVIVSHDYPLLYGSDDSEPMSRLTHGAMTLGGFAVGGFFVLSGFLITASWNRNPRLAPYLKKRAMRIYPGFIAAFAVCYLIVSPLAAGTFRVLVDRGNLAAGIESLLFFQAYGHANLFPSNPYPGAVNGSIWTIKYEFLCYIAVALLGMLGIFRRRFSVLAALACCVLTWATERWFTHVHWPTGGGFRLVSKLLSFTLGMPNRWPLFASYYLAGVAAYLFRREIRFRWYLATAAAVMVVGTGWFDPSIMRALAPVLLGYLLLYAGLATQFGVHRFGAHGDFSYGIYLYAFPIQQLLVKFGHFSSGSLFLLAWPLSILAGFLSWNLVERHFLPLKSPAPQSESTADTDYAHDSATLYEPPAATQEPLKR